MVSQSQLAASLGFRPEQATASTLIAPGGRPAAFRNAEEQRVAQLAYGVIRRLESRPQIVPSLSYLQSAEVQARVVREVAGQYRPAQLAPDGVAPQLDIATIVAQTSALVVQQTVDIPRIIVVPRGEVRSGFTPFALQLDTLRYPPVSDELWIQHLRTNQLEVLALGKGGMEEARLEDYVVSGLVDFDDISYDDHADLLYDLAAQVVSHLRGYLSEDDTRKVLRCYQKPIAKFVHVQMQDHFWEDASGYEVVVSRGFTELKPSAYTASAAEPVFDFHQSPADKSNMAKYLFGGFARCLYPVQKFQSDSERCLAVILDRDSLKWFKPAKGQFQIYYKSGADQLEYQPDFVAETGAGIYMLEPKARREMDAADVLAKRDAAVQWCRNASNYAATCGGKPWQYVLIPHDVIAENVTLELLARQFEVR